MKKILIKIETQRQFEDLMNHFNDKGWVLANGRKPRTSYTGVKHVSYHDEAEFYYADIVYEKKYNIIDFDTFSQLTGVKVVDAIELKFSQLVTGKVTKDRIDFYANGENHAISFLDKKDIEEIYTAINSLQ